MKTTWIKLKSVRGSLRWAVIGLASIYILAVSLVCGLLGFWGQKRGFEESKRLLFENQEKLVSSLITYRIEQLKKQTESFLRPAEIQAVRHFLDRRLDLTVAARHYFAADLASRLAPRVAGIPPYSHPEYVLEGIVVAKQSRS